MRLEPIYWLLCVLGTILPLSAFVPWLLAHGADMPLFFAELFSTRIGSFFGWDVMVSAIVLLVWVWAERSRSVPGAWLVVPATFVVGVSLGLPLYLALRERAARKAA